MKKLFTRIACLALAATIALASCEGPEGDAGAKGDQGDKGDKGDKGDQGEDYPSAVELKAHSITTPDVLIKKTGFENVEVYPLISSEDLISGFTFGGSADGSGLLKLNNGYSLLVNHEDNFSVSRIFLDETFRPVSGEYILNSDGGKWRLCSATLATPEEHGFGPLYLTCGESSVESRTHALNPFAQGAQASQTRELQAFGRWNAEQALPLPKTAYPDKTVVMIGDDDSSIDGGQVAMYVSNTVGDLAGGKLYVLRRKDLVTREKDMEEEDVVDIEFVEITGQTTMLGSEINAKSTELKSIAFNRVEDLDYRKDGVGREVYFNVTGNSANTADRSQYGRTYRIVLNENNPLEGTLELILDGDDRAGKAKDYQDVDNIMVTQNYVYIQEDPNGYGTEAHDAYVYQYNIATKELKPVFELNHFRGDATLGAKFKSTNSAKGSWEYGSMIDISDIIDVENTFLLCIQLHTWRLPAFKNPDGGTGRPNEDQGSMIAVIKGLPR
jgi:hypothetical protein